MSLFEIPHESITQAELQLLVTNGIRESITLDFKEKLPGRSDNDKREFVRDVVAFANAEGGDLLFGVKEQDGVAHSVVGVSVTRVDVEIQRFASLLRDCVDPRIHGLSIRAITLETGRHVLAVRSPSSLDAPHMVTLGNYRQFWIRNPSGKHPMSVAEVRNAVTRTENWKERSDQWRRERVQLVESGEFPVLLEGEGRLYVHIVPLPVGGPTLNLADDLVRDRLTSVVSGGQGSGWDYRMTYDGFLVARHLPGTGEYNRWYRIWFHDGSVEFVNSNIVQHRERSKYSVVGGPFLEKAIEENVRNTVRVDAAGTASPPLLVYVSLANVEGSFLSGGDTFADSLDPTPFDRDVLFIPSILIEEPTEDYWPLLAPAINRIWQSGGRPRSPYFKSDGSRHIGNR